MLFNYKYKYNYCGSCLMVVFLFSVSINICFLYPNLNVPMQKQKLDSWQECNVPCAHECVMGQWSDWSVCALATCPGDVNYTSPDVTRFKRSRTIKGFQRRYRTIYEDNGRPEDCPHTLEVTPCEDARLVWIRLGKSHCCRQNHKYSFSVTHVLRQVGFYDLGKRANFGGTGPNLKSLIIFNFYSGTCPFRYVKCARASTKYL